MSVQIPVFRRFAVMAAILPAILGLCCGVASAAAPAPTAPVLNPPDSVAVLGDSMSVATGISIIPSATSPEHSWATGSNATVNSVWNRIKALNPAVTRDNRAANGKKMTDAAGQAGGISSGTRLVLIQMGGNDLCRDTVADMTPTATYRSQFVAALDTIEQKAPNALVMVSSVPDIWNLWFLRGAPNPPNPVPSSRAGTARTFWDTLAVIPCQSLVKSPTDMSPEAVQRRADVRQRDIDYNNALLEECSARLRCRTDSFATFNFSSNRATTWGDILPPAQWEFVDDDISTVDHFHPSISGQAKMAAMSWNNGWNYGENTPPIRSDELIQPAPAAGVNWSPVTAGITWSDDAGIKGIEYRVHHNGTAGPWQTSLSALIPPAAPRGIYTYPAQHSVSVPVTQSGVSYIETRAMDGNGNLAASRITTVNYDPAAIPAPAVNSGPSGTVAERSAEFTFSGIPADAAGATYECSLDDAVFSACTSPRGFTGLADGPHSFRVRIAGGGSQGPPARRDWTVAATPPPAPVITAGPAGAVRTKSATIEFTASAPGGAQCSLDGSEFAACGSPLQLTGLADGAHSVAVRQLNEAGVAGDEATRDWIVDTLAPAAPVLSGAPSGLTNTNTASLTFTGEPGGTFECSLDGGAFNTCTSPRQLNGLADGSHTFRVRQRDTAGNTGPAAEATWTVDRTAPAAPALTGAPSGLTGTNTASLTFTGEPGGTFECSLDGGGFSTCTSPRQLNGLADGSHTFRVRQRDTAGNTGPAAEATWTVDRTAPAAPALTGAPSGLTGTNTASLTFTGEPDATFECSLDGGAFTGCESPHQLEGLAEGGHTFAVRQRNQVGVEGPPATASWTVDTVAPDTPGLTGAPSGLTNTNTASLTFTGEPDTTFECSLDGGAFSTCTSPRQLNGLADGSHTFRVRQRDAAGNTGPAAEATWTVDTVAPPAPVLAGAPSGLVRSAAATVIMTTETGATLECRINDGAWAVCTSPWSAATLRQGTHVFQARQTDAAGNTGPEATATWTVDTIAPKLKGKPKLKLKGKARKGRPARYTLTTAWVAAGGIPSTLEFSVARKPPRATAAPVPGLTMKWKKKLVITSRKKPAWIRLSDLAGNRSAWTRVR